MSKWFFNIGLLQKLPTILYARLSEKNKCECKFLPVDDLHLCMLPPSYGDPKNDVRFDKYGQPYISFIMIDEPWILGASRSANHENVRRKLLDGAKRWPVACIFTNFTFYLSPIEHSVIRIGFLFRPPTA